MAKSRPANIVNNVGGRKFKQGEGLPRVSTNLDSIRAYQFEVQFDGVPNSKSTDLTNLTLAAKQVSPVGMATESIEVRRINDLIKYPGQSKFEAVTITFDNLLLMNTSEVLWNWFKVTSYDPITGYYAPLGNRSFKANKMSIIELNHQRDPQAVIELYGVYPRSVKFAEKNYATNQFSTVEVEFSFDFMDFYNYDNRTSLQKVGDTIRAVGRAIISGL